jgi:outer membrane protein TolC
LSAFAGSRHSLIGQHLAERSVKNRLVTAFEQARINLNSARQRIEITRRNRDLAGKVYERALRFQRSRKVTEFEIIERLRSLLSAKNDHIEALIAAKKAESTLLASVGLLSERYAQRISQTPVDRHRLKALAAGGLLKYFGVAK